MFLKTKKVLRAASFSVFFISPLLLWKLAETQTPNRNPQNLDPKKRMGILHSSIVGKIEFPNEGPRVFGFLRPFETQRKPTLCLSKHTIS